MNRGVPPTALKARTGEFTPPGMTRCARSNSAVLLVDTAAGSLGAAVVCQCVGLGRSGLLALFGRRHGPEEAVGHDIAHARAEARVQALVEEGQRLANGGLQLAAPDRALFACRS